MAITVNTNVASLTAQKSLNAATSKMNTAMERMSTGYKINSSKDDAAGLAVSKKLSYQVSSLSVAQSNAQMGVSMLDSVEGVLGVISDSLQRVRDLTEQAANGTYGTDAIKAINTEITARMTEITRVADSAEFNDKKLLNGKTSEGGIEADINLQVGIDHESYSVVTLNSDIFARASASALFTDSNGDLSEYFNGNVFKGFGNVTGGTKTADVEAHDFLKELDSAISNITDRTTQIGGRQAAISSAADTANVMSTNLTSANSLIKDADIAQESSNYIKQQILQQSSATLLSTANQAPNIALNLV